MDTTPLFGTRAYFDQKYGEGWWGLSGGRYEDHSGGGGGGVPGSGRHWTDQFNTGPSLGVVVNHLWHSQYGGSWTPAGGYSYFRSDAEAVAAGMAYNEYHNSWSQTTYGAATGGQRKLAQRTDNGDYFQIAENGKLYLPYTDVSYWDYRQNEERRSNGVDVSALTGALAVGEMFRQTRGIVDFGRTAERAEALLKEGKFLYGNTTYSTNFYGNQYINTLAINENKVAFNSAAKFTRNLGRGMAAVGVGLAVVKLYTSDRSGADYARFAGAVIITGSAFIPVLGPAISIGLGIADSFGAFDSIYYYFD